MPLKTLWEKGKCWKPAFSPYTTMFSTLPKANFSFTVTFILSSAIAFHFHYSSILLFGKELTFSRSGPCFNVSVVQVFLKTVWEKEKLLLMSNFSFSHIIFSMLMANSPPFSSNVIVVCKTFQFGLV